MHDNLGRETRSCKLASRSLPLTKQQEKQMKKNNETRFTEKLKQYGFKKKETGEKGFHMWEMSPADLESRQRIHDNLKKEEKENA